MDYLGGRKFVMGIIVILAGVLIELYGKNGLSTNMVALLGAIYAAFNTANAIVTNKMAGAESAAASQPANTVELEAKLVPIVNVIAEELKKINENQARQEKALQVVQEAQLATQKVLISTRQ